MKIVIESPLRGKTPEETRANLRYLLWCCRAVYLAGHHPIASHLICPWFMDDSNEKERADGIDWPWMWEPGAQHWFFDDNGVSRGMEYAQKRCVDTGCIHQLVYLALLNRDCADAYQRGEWPPHTEGFGFE